MPNEELAEPTLADVLRVCVAMEARLQAVEAQVLVRLGTSSRMRAAAFAGGGAVAGMVAEFLRGVLAHM